MPFEQAVKTLAGIIGVEVSAMSAVRITEKSGAIYVEMQTEEVKQLEKTAADAAKGVEKLVFSADGAWFPCCTANGGK